MVCRNVFFIPIPSHSQWFIQIPIHTPRFNLVLFPFPPAPIPVLLVVSHQITDDRETVAPEAFQKWGHKFRREAPEKMFFIVPPIFRGAPSH